MFVKSIRFVLASTFKWKFLIEGKFAIFYVETMPNISFEEIIGSGPLISSLAKPFLVFEKAGGVADRDSRGALHAAYTSPAGRGSLLVGADHPGGAVQAVVHSRVRAHLPPGTRQAAGLS